MIYIDVWLTLGLDFRTAMRSHLYYLGSLRMAFKTMEHCETIQFFINKSIIRCCNYLSIISIEDTQVFVWLGLMFAFGYAEFIWLYTPYLGKRKAVAINVLWHANYTIKGVYAEQSFQIWKTWRPMLYIKAVAVYKHPSKCRDSSLLSVCLHVCPLILALLTLLKCSCPWTCDLYSGPEPVRARW